MSRFFVFLHSQRRAIVSALALCAALGIAFGLRLPAAILPEVTFPRVTVIAESGEIPGAEMLRAVTRPLEDSIRRVPGVKRMRSTTSRGSAEINLDCAWRSDMDLTLQRIQARLDAVRADLPAGTTLEARLMSPAIFPVIGYSLTSPTRSLVELRDLADTVLRPELARLPGAAEVVIQGGRKLEARVALDPAALQARGLDAAGIAARLRTAGDIASVGLIDRNRELYLGLVDARPPDLETLRATPIPVAGGAPVALGDLATISLEESPEYVRYAARDREAVLVNLLRQTSASTIGLSQEVRRWFEQHRSALPSDVRVEIFYDQSDLVRSSVTSVRDSLIVGALLAILVVVLFLRSLRLGLAGAIVLPASIGLTMLGFLVTRQSLNMMTLGGIAAAVGLVLDDAIVVVEHLAHRASHEAVNEAAPDAVPAATQDAPRALGWNGGEAAGPGRTARAMAEIFPSLVGSSLCTIAIFVPFMLLGGVTGAFFRVLALSMVLMLGSSLLICVGVLPLAGRLRVARASAPPRHGDRFGRFLRRAVSRWWVAFVPPACLVAAIIPLKGSLGSGFLPEMDEGSLILDYILPPGTSLTESDRILKRVEQEIDATTAVTAWSRRTGDQLGFFITEPNVGDYVLRLAARGRASSEEVADQLRGRIESNVPGIEIEFGQLVEDVIGDLTTSPQPIEAKVFGEDRRVLEDKARDAARIISSVRGVVDVKNGITVSGPNLVIEPRAEAARLGLSASDLAESVEPAMQGLEAGRIVRGSHAWPVRVVLPVGGGTAGAGDPRAIRGLSVPVTPGRWVPLGELATVRVDAGETEINRDDQRTAVSITARLSGRDLGTAMGEIRSRLKRELPLPRAMGVQYGGLWAEQQSSFRGLALVMAGAVAAVTLILLASFRSWRQTGAVLLTVVASLAGAFVALHVAGGTFNISSFVGAIMVVGIVAENAYFLVAEHRRGLCAELDPAEAAVAAACRRARPILMTTFAGIAALAPLALGLSAGSALLSPLAQAVVGGFFTSAPLLLVVLPALLARTGRAA